ncbi:helix-turn-helix transcriptional regulator [Niallia circulans]|uniref:Helix-turn-helix domain-containing protein n=1 Tax=Niallia circulans TaxID=1397 RepID=A0A941GQ67_NIACI|nr:helix-turn-helix transcriptional regulator [Niallia circulans]MCB5238636.1 helix-turn-helix transcriptional regulator [Niallia circulans]
MNNSNSSKALGQFLKSRRERLQPEKVGIKDISRRRTPGLRREEVAYLANISVTYYTWLEQGRNVKPSQEILRNIGLALELDDDELMHLFDLSEIGSLQPQENIDEDEEEDSTSLYTAVRQLNYPSFIINDSTEVLAWNKAAELVITDFNAWPKEERFMLNIMFSDEKIREQMVNFREFITYSVAVFRGICDRHPDRPEYLNRAEWLCEKYVEFKSLWEQHDVRQKRITCGIFQHPKVGLLEFQAHSLSVDGNPTLHWSIYTPDSMETEGKLFSILDKNLDR